MAHNSKGLRAGLRYNEEKFLEVAMNWNRYFTMLSDWKKLPAYKAEPRIDSFIGYYLPQIVNDYCHENIVGIIPELPLRCATVQPAYEDTGSADRSYKVDFYLLSSDGTNYLVEFKTDSGSRSNAQDFYLGAARTVGMKALVAGICRIAAVSAYKNKYRHLLMKLAEIGLIGNNREFAGRSDRIDIIYIQPRSTQGDKCISLDWISNWMRQRYSDNEFEVELASKLEEWAT